MQWERVRTRRLDSAISRRRARQHTDRTATAKPAHLVGVLQVDDRGVRSRWAQQLRWFVFGAVAAFLVSFVGSSVLHLQHDVYLALYFAFVGLLMWTYVSRNQIDVREVLRRNWRWGILAGLVLLVPVMGNVLSNLAPARLLLRL